jgi:hypothetical protein
MSVPDDVSDDAYPKTASCVLNYISTLLIKLKIELINIEWLVISRWIKCPFSFRCSSMIPFLWNWIPIQSWHPLVPIHKVSLYWPLEFKSRDFPGVNISRYKAINTDGCFMRIINCLPFSSIWVRARYFSCVVFCFCLFLSFSLVSCVLNVASFSGLSLVYVLCAQCCQFLWIVLSLCLVCSMLPVSLDCP